METLDEWFVRESWSDKALGENAIWYYRDCQKRGQRMGQAFFNALHPDQSVKLRSTMYDPFYGSQKEVHAAIEFLTRKD